MDKARRAARESAVRCARAATEPKRWKARTCLCQGVARTTDYVMRPLTPRRARVEDWCCTDAWFATTRSDCRLMHCLPVRRNVAIADAVLDGSRAWCDGRPTTACPHRWLCCTDCSNNRSNHDRHDPASIRSRCNHWRIAQRLSLYPPLQGQDLRRQSRRRDIRRRSAHARAVEQISLLHTFGVRVVMVHGGGRSSPP